LTLSRPPLRAATRRSLAVDQKPLEPRQQSIPVRKLAGDDLNPNPRWASPPPFNPVRRIEI
jgi:hypothetical protein